MDLHDFTDCELYFEQPLSHEISGLIDAAALHYGEPEAESFLLRAYFLAPENLTVLVGLYRYYFYQHRLDDALIVAERALAVAATQLRLNTDWRYMTHAHLGDAAQRSFGLLRFYLIALKAASVVLLRLGRFAAARERLQKLAELDSNDRLGVARLLEVVNEFQPALVDDSACTEDDKELQHG